MAEGCTTYQFNVEEYQSIAKSIWPKIEECHYILIIKGNDSEKRSHGSEM